jgi:ribosomal protein S18 acetylase RimI-like enzyme
MYFSEYRNVSGGALLFSDQVKDPYYNFYAPDERAAPGGIPGPISEEFARRQRTPAVYATPLAPAYDGLAGGTEWARDAWLVGEVAALDASTQADGVTIQVVGDEWRDVYVETFAAAYSGDDPADPYGQLDEGYVRALRGSFAATAEGYRKYYLLASAGDSAVGVAVLFTNGTLAGVYGVGTTPAWRRRSVGTALMASMTDIARRDGADWILLQTEDGSAVQRWYQKLGYQDVFTAAYLTFEPER